MIKWQGDPPKTCNLCEVLLSTVPFFIDGVTLDGHWTIMCPKCYSVEGMGLGLGRGQKYDTKTLEKIEGEGC